MDYLKKNHTYDLVKLPNDKRTLKNKWMLKLKQEVNSAKLRYRARLVVKGFTQKKGVDYFNMHSHVARISTSGVLLD